MYFVYILRSLKNKKTYVGKTDEILVVRLHQHNTGSNKWTRNNKPFELIYYESYYCKADAAHREQFLKSGIGNKLVSLIRDNFNSDYIKSSASPISRP